MRTKVTLVLVFLNVALFFFIFKFERAWRTDEQLREVRRLVLGPEAADIRSLTVNSTVSGSSFSLERRGEVWWLTKPLEWPANPHAVSGIVQALKLLEHETSFSTTDLAKNGVSLATYGLDHPRLAVVFTSAEPGTAASPSTLKIGDATNDRLYILSPDGERIHVVSRALADTLALTLDQLRAPPLFTIPVFEARSLRVQSGGADQTHGADQLRGGATAGVPVRIRRDGARWTFESPHSGRGSKTDIEIAINGLDSLRAKTFDPANPPATRPAAAPALRITLEGNNRSETLYLGDPVAPPAAGVHAPEVEYYAQLEGSEPGGKPRAAIFTVVVPAELKAKLDNAPVTLRERRVLDFDPHNVTAITLAAPLQPNQPTITLQRLDPTATAADGGDWQLIRRGDPTSGPQTLPADRAAVQRLLDQLRLLSAKTTDGFVNDAPGDDQLENYGFKRPEREVTLTLSEPGASRAGTVPASAKNTTLVLQIASDANHKTYARVDPALNPKASSVYAVDFEFDRELQVTPLAWRNRQLRERLPDAARITALTLAPVAEGATPVYTHTLTAGETWDAALAAEPSARKDALTKVLAQLVSLHAQSFLQEKFTDKIFVAGEERPWRYRLDATVSLPGGTGGEQTSTLTLFLGERVGGAQQYAGSKELDVVFALDQPLLDALVPLLYPRDPGPPPAESPKPEPPVAK